MIKYKYCRDKDNRPLITICERFSEFNPKCYIGIAICSPKDNPNKKIGKKIAHDRAKYANFEYRDTDLPISRTEALQVLENCNADYEFKSMIKEVAYK